MTTPCILRHLEDKGLFHIVPGLERMSKVLEMLNVQKPPFQVIQVVGTNGKGSTCAFLSSLAMTRGLKVGTHTSPHFLSPLERITINGSPLPIDRWQRAFAKLLTVGGEELSYFECITAMSMVLFAEEKVDIAVMETGLGGTWDATTAIAADLVLFSSISLDHQNILGNSVSAVAKDKAGAIRANTFTLSVEQSSEAAQELIQAANLKDSPLLFVRPKTANEPKGTPSSNIAKSHKNIAEIAYPEHPVQLSLPGEYQLQNSALALAAWRYIQVRQSMTLQKMDISSSQTPDLEAKALQNAFIAGRMQYLPANSIPTDLSPTGFLPPVILDGGHNPAGLAALGLSLGKKGIAPLAVIFSCLEDKDVQGLITHLRSLATGQVFVPHIPNNERALPPEKLATSIGLNAVPAVSMKDALGTALEHMNSRMPEAFTDETGKHPLLICGSLYLLAEFYKIFPQTLHK